MKDLAQKEAELNRLPHFKTEIDGQTIHFILSEFLAGRFVLEHKSLTRDIVRPELL
jgi:hypothetical protein